MVFYVRIYIYIYGGSLLGKYFYCLWFLKSIFLCFVFYYPYAKYKNVYVLFFTIVLSLFVVYYKFNEMYICFYLVRSFVNLKD